MKIKTAKNIMKGVGVAMAVGSAMMMAESCMLTTTPKSTKKIIKKAVNKLEDMADIVCSM